nr:hypothetical protein BaRGS_018308 [Batillaria attramentaria]
MLETNVLGVLSLTKCVLPHMMQRKAGHIVVMSSIAGKVGAPFSGSYTGSKHALHVLGREMGKEEKRMETSRCAYLCAVAIANRLDEAWISLQPVLVGTYVAQYAPSFYRGRMKRMGVEQLLKIREGQ